MKAVAVYEILPSERLWSNEYLEVRFESAPITLESGTLLLLLLLF
jgi:hypothetical protein